MNNILKEQIKYSFYPLLDVKETHYDGILFTKNKLCDTCISKECIDIKNKKDYYIKKCYKELLSFKVTIHGKTFIMYGIKNDYNSLSRIEKKKYESKIWYAAVVKW